MEFLGYQSWLHPTALTLAVITIIWTVVWIRSWRAVEHTIRRRRELEVLYEPDNGTSPSTRKSDHAVEYVLASQSLPT